MLQAGSEFRHNTINNIYALSLCGVGGESRCWCSTLCSKEFSVTFLVEIAFSTVGFSPEGENYFVPLACSGKWRWWSYMYRQPRVSTVAINAICMVGFKHQSVVQIQFCSVGWIHHPRVVTTHAHPVLIEFYINKFCSLLNQNWFNSQASKKARSSQTPSNSHINTSI